jgi:DNA-binding transcriptional MocR family regulator
MAANNRTITLTRGVPPAEALPGDQIAECAASIIREDPTVLLSYGSTMGYLPLREWLAKSHCVAVGQVLVSNGSLQIMGFLTRTLLAPGDTVFVESPSYDRAVTIFRGYGAKLVGIPLKTDGIVIEDLEKALTVHRPKLVYVIPDFQNPAGVTTSLAKRKRIVELAEKHGFWIAEDVPYRRLRYQGADEPTFLSLAPERTLQLSSFSKLLSPGVRAGYVIGPADAIAKLAKTAEDTYITPSLPSQGIVYEYCRRGWLEPNIARLKELYRPRLEATLSALASELPEADFMRPEGGYFVGVNLPPGISNATLLARAKAAALALTDGDGFFLEPPARTFVRIPFCGVSPTDIREGIARLAAIVKEG